jgi:hypothetical protein
MWKKPEDWLAIEQAVELAAANAAVMMTLFFAALISIVHHYR